MITKVHIFEHHQGNNIQKQKINLISTATLTILYQIRCRANICKNFCIDITVNHVEFHVV